jgi:hypothetical protein
VVVAVEDPPVPVVGDVLGPVGAVKLEFTVFQRARIEDRKRRVSRIQSDVVVPPDQEVAIEALEVVDRLLAVPHIHRHVAEMHEEIVGADRLVVAIEEHAVHLAGGGKRPVTVVDDVRVAEMVIGDDKSGHSRGSLPIRLTVWVASAERTSRRSRNCRGRTT